MNKNLKIVLITLVCVAILSWLWIVIYFYKGEVSKIWLAREFWERFNPNYIQGLIQYRSNISGVSEITWSNEKGEVVIKRITGFDDKWDILFYPDEKLQNIDQSQLSWEWMMFGIPKTEQYEVGVSVCYNGIFNCKTTYYKTPTCLKLVYMPRYLNRKRDENIMSWCEVVDISKRGRSDLYFSVKY